MGIVNPDTQPGAIEMNIGKIKEALVTTAVVLATIYALNQVSLTRNVVQKALA